MVSPANSPVRLGVSPAAASTPTGIFNQRFEALFPRAGALGCWSPGLRGLFHRSAVPPGLSMRECGAAGSTSTTLWSLLDAGWPAPLHSPQSATLLGPPAAALRRVLWLPISAPPNGLDECFFFISLVVGLPYSLIFCQFWLFFVFKLLLSFFGCARRHSVSTYASILAGTP